MCQNSVAFSEYLNFIKFHESQQNKNAVQIKVVIIITIGNKNKFNNLCEIAIAPQVKIASFVRIFTIIKFHFFIIFGKEMKKVYLISHCCNFCCIQEIEHQKELVVMEQKQTHIKSIKTNLGIRLLHLLRFISAFCKVEFLCWIKCHAIFKNISFQDYKFRSFHEHTVQE